MVSTHAPDHIVIQIVTQMAAASALAALGDKGCSIVKDMLSFAEMLLFGLLSQNFKCKTAAHNEL